jgi:di/tricarboxylate transporter
VTLLEVMLAPRSKSAGQTLKETKFRNQYGFTAVAVRRMDRSYRTNVGDITLQLGDSILLIGPQEKVKSLQNDTDFIVLQPSTQDQPVDRKQAGIAIGVVAATVTASILGMPVYLSMLLGALVIILSGILTMEEAYRSIEWQAIFLIAGMYTVSLAMVQTGLANRLGDLMTRLTTPFGAIGLAAGAYLLSGLLTQVMGGQVTALVTGPVAISAAIAMGISPQAVAVATALGCSAMFLTPFAHPVNILMIAPANYRFQDFFHIGWPLTIASFLMLILGMWLFWGLR